jgi:NADH:ubiquinone reductase (H+-translocating)
MHVGGFIGWWVWLFIHIGFLTGYRNRVGAVLGWWFAFTRDLRRNGLSPSTTCHWLRARTAR